MTGGPPPEKPTTWGALVRRAKQSRRDTVTLEQSTEELLRTGGLSKGERTALQGVRLVAVEQRAVIDTLLRQRPETATRAGELAGAALGVAAVALLLALAALVVALLSR